MAQFVVPTLFGLEGPAAEELRRMGQRSRRYAEEHLTRDANLTRVVQAIEQILNNNQ